MSVTDKPFWETKSLEQLTAEEWEALCDGCGQCCLIKLEDIDTGERVQTRLACRLLDIGSCRCSAYPERHDRIPDCVSLTPEACHRLDWLPETCAYRLRAEGKSLKWWHPLRSGDPNTVHEVGISVRSWAVSESRTGKRSPESFIVNSVPPGGRRAALRRRRRGRV